MAWSTSINKTPLKRLTATSVRENATIVKYHSTNVVVFDDRVVTLDTGGWYTNTTKNRMNQASREFDLGYEVNQVDGEWIVTLPNGGEKKFIETDVVSFLR